MTKCNNEIYLNKKFQNLWLLILLFSTFLCLKVGVAYIWAFTVCLILYCTIETNENTFNSVLKSTFPKCLF